MNSFESLSYVCVYCGSEVEALFKSYSPSVLKLINCETCRREADKYIEYDNVVILIDLILFRTQAYRHIIHNTEFKNHWKLGILVLLMKTCSEWATHCSTSSSEPHRLKPLVLEQTFYKSFLVTLAGGIVYSAFVLSVLFLYEGVQFLTFKWTFLKCTWKALILSNFGQFLMLPSLIWTDHQKEVHILLVAIYCLLSQMQALSIVSRMHRPVLLIVLFFAVIAEQYVVNFKRDCKPILK